MKKSFTIIYSIIAGLIIIFAISFFAVNLYNENTHGELRTQVRFEKMANAVNTAVSKQNISNAELTRQLQNAIGDTKDFSYIKIVSQGKTIYVYPENFSDVNDTQSNLILSYKKTGSQNTQINAGLYTLRPGTIFYYAKISFFIILIVALITIILILFTNQFDNKKVPLIKKQTPVKNNIINSAIEEEDDNDDYNVDDKVNVADNDDDNNADNDEDVNNVQVETSDNKTTETENDAIEETVEPVKAPAAPAELPVKDFEPVELSENNSERGLFSEDTGLGWESYLLTRLENELNRATASELDLSLFIIKINGITRKNPLIKKICDYLIVEFQFKDLLFEYKEDCVCALKISMTLDDAVSFAERLGKEIKELLPEENLDVYIGISSRGIRMVSGERLLKEADEAVMHAMEDKTCPVVGFKADAVKYRKFIETK